MGWIGIQTDKPNHVVVTEEIEWGGNHKVVARSGRYYAVETSDGEVYALVALIRKKDGYTHTKLVDEGMGPNYRRCPAKILDMLSPTDSKYAIEWREDCRRNVAKHVPKITPGMSFQLDEPLTFSDGVRATDFMFVGGYKARRHVDKQLVRLPKTWRYSKWCLIKEEV